MVLERSSLESITRITGMEKKAVTRALARLVTGGLVTHDSVDGYRISLGQLQALAQAVSERVSEAGIDAPPEQASVLRAFFKGDRLTSVPVARAKRLIVLDYLAQSFEPGRRYPERDVNEILSRFHDDYATLRRYLVDEGFLSRERGRYWRSGGRMETD